MSTPDIDLIVEAELDLLSISGLSSVRLLPPLAKLPYRLEPGLTDDILPQLLSSFGLPHCHGRSGFPPSPEMPNSGYFGGGRGGGGDDARAFGMGIALEDMVGENRELKLPDLEGDLNRSEGLEPWMYISGRSTDGRCARL